jgi:hypothetical protein
MASDSMGGEADGTSVYLDKIWEDSGVLFGYTGNTAVRDPLQIAVSEALQGVDPRQSRWEMIATLCPAVRRVIEPAYHGFVPAGAKQSPLDELRGILLVIGEDGDGYWLADINEHCTATGHWDRGFHTVGSGSLGAQIVNALFEHHDIPRLDAFSLQKMAYRSVAACIKVLPRMGVGGDVRLWRSAETGFAEARESELEGLRRAVEEWLRDEYERFTLIGTETAEPPVDQPPEPPASGSVSV